MKLWHKILFLLLIIFSFILRAWKLDNNPAGFFCDEAMAGYEAFNILTTGRDQYGTPFPLFFRWFNFDNASPYIVYFNIPSIILFGLNEFAVRLTSVFWSTVEILLFFLLLKEFIPKNFALVGTLLLSISPWHFHISRIAIADFYSWPLFTLTAYYCLIRAFKTNKANFWFLSSTFFGMANYSYIPARLITPIIFGLTMVLLYLAKRKIAPLAIMTCTYLIILVPFVHFHLTNPHSFERVGATTGINLNTSIIDVVIQEELPSHFVEKYLAHFSEAFLFQKGDVDYPGQFIRRHSIANMGLLYPYQKWLIVIGLVWLIKEVIKQKKYELLFILFLFLVFPLADSLTSDGTPFATRSYLGVLPFHILITFGLYASYTVLSKLLINLRLVKTTAILFVLIVASSSVIKLINNFIANPLTTSDFWGWQYGPKEIMNYFLQVKDSYDDLYMSGEFNGSEIFLKFYDPKGLCQNKCRISDPWRSPAIIDPSRHQLFSLSPEYLDKSELAEKFLIKHSIYYPNGKTAFLIGEVAF